MLQHPMFSLLKIPDLVSMLNGFFGLTAIYILIIDFELEASMRFHIALVLILLGLLADGLDGILARRYGKGTLGVYFEAMSDMTTMGITPAIFIAFLFKSTYQADILNSLILWIFLLFYLCAAFVRLASFHPLENKEVFIGFPASATTMFLLSIIFLFESLIILYIAVLISAVLMILPIPFPKPTKLMNIITVMVIFLTIFIGFFNSLIYLLLLFSVLLYMIGGQFYLFFTK